MLAPGVSAFQNLLIVIINMFIPCAIVIFCFTRIFARIRKVSKNLRKSASKNSSQMNNHQAHEIIYLYNNGSVESSAKYSPTMVDKNGKTNKVVIHKTSISSIQREIKITKMFALIFVVFLFGYLPYGVIRLIDAKNSLHPDFYVFLTIIFIISITVSPVIYGLMNKCISSHCIILLNKLTGCFWTKKFPGSLTSGNAVSRYTSTAKKSSTDEELATQKQKPKLETVEFSPVDVYTDHNLQNYEKMIMHLESDKPNETIVLKEPNTVTTQENSTAIVPAITISTKNKMSGSDSENESKDIRSRSFTHFSGKKSTKSIDIQSLKPSIKIAEESDSKKADFSRFIENQDDGGIYKGPDN